MSSPALALRGVSYGYRPGAAAVLEGLDLSVGAGEFVCLLGPSGCGKSTLLNLVAGHLSPRRGEITVHGGPVGPTPPGLAMVFQSDALFPWLTVEDNVAFGPRCRGLHDAREVRHWLDRVGLGAFARHYPGQLSGGMRQRAALARALVMKTRVLLMDEPFGALDAQTRESMQELLSELHAELRPTVLMVTHDLDEAVFLADRVLVLSAVPGRVLEEVRVDHPRPRGAASRETRLSLDLRAHLRETLRSVDVKQARLSREEVLEKLQH